MASAPGSERMLRLDELLAAVSQATDLAHDRPMKSALGDTLHDLIQL